MPIPLIIAFVCLGLSAILGTIALVFQWKNKRTYELVNVETSNTVAEFSSLDEMANFLHITEMVNPEYADKLVVVTLNRKGEVVE